MKTNRNVEGNQVRGSRWGRRRIYGGLAGWSVVAAAASGLGLAAVSLLGNDLGTGAVAYAGTAGSSASVSGTSTAHSAEQTLSGQADWTAGLFSTRGGQIIARCAGSAPSVTVVPAANWMVRQDDRQGGEGPEVVLTSGQQRIEVHIGCAVTGPTFETEGNRPTGAVTTRAGAPTSTVDDHGHHAEPGDDRGSSTSTVTSTGVDDHGGQGAEPGDDNGGRGVEAGDDNGGSNIEPGDDKGSDRSTPSTTSRSTTSSSRTTDDRTSRSADSPTSTSGRPTAGATSQKSGSETTRSEKSTAVKNTPDDRGGSGRGGSGGSGADDH